MDEWVGRGRSEGGEPAGRSIGLRGWYDMRSGGGVQMLCETKRKIRMGGEQRMNGWSAAGVREGSWREEAPG